MSWPGALVRMAKMGKPLLIASGASELSDVTRAMEAVTPYNKQLVLMQCNTNYTASDGNYDHLHLNVLKTYAALYPNVVLGLSDHTHSPAPVVGAVALGARVIERHFTILPADVSRDGPVSINPTQLGHLVKFSRLDPKIQAEFVRMEIPEFEKTLGNRTRTLSHEEELNRDYYRGRFASRVGDEVIYNWEDKQVF